MSGPGHLLSPALTGEHNFLKYHIESEFSAELLPELADALQYFTQRVANGRPGDSLKRLLIGHIKFYHDYVSPGKSLSNILFWHK